MKVSKASLLNRVAPLAGRKLARSLVQAALALGSLFALAPALAQGPHYLEHGGLRRSYELRLPHSGHGALRPGASGHKLPLVIALHGGMGTGGKFEASSALTPVAQREGFVLVYPNGTGPGGTFQTWNAGACCGTAASREVDDVGFISKLIDVLVQRYPIDPSRVLVTGHSNGGMLAWRLACELSEKVAAAVPNAAALTMSSCEPKRPGHVLVLHSLRDRNVPLAGGRGIGPSGVEYPSMQASMALTAKALGCNAQPQSQAAPPQVRHQAWASCAGAASLDLMVSEDGGHAWPGGSADWARGDTPSQALNANAAIVELLQRLEKQTKR